MQTPKSVGFHDKRFTNKRAPKKIPTPLMVVRHWTVRSEILGLDIVARCLESVASRPTQIFGALFWDVVDNASEFYNAK